jgi:hypothetical protein
LKPVQKARILLTIGVSSSLWKFIYSILGDRRANFGRCEYADSTRQHWYDYAQNLSRVISHSLVLFNLFILEI